ncbi:hypothetical protein KHP62_22815, partial [Rhodobacteraceae bacterium NNCM2]|nr:hypothetical protein [Coraliihabitans acroporae]
HKSTDHFTPTNQQHFKPPTLLITTTTTTTSNLSRCLEITDATAANPANAPRTTAPANKFFNMILNSVY